MAGVDRGGVGNEGKKTGGDGGEKERTASPFSLSRFSPLSSPPPPCLFLHLPRRVYRDVLSVQAIEQKCNIVVRDFWIRSFSRTEFLTQHVQFRHFLSFTSKVSCLISEMLLHEHVDPGERKLTVLRVRRLVYIVLVGSVSP